VKTVVRLLAPFATLRKPFARSYGETFEEVTPRAAKQVLLSLIGEWKRGAHPDAVVTVKHLTKSRVALTIRKYDQRKYGVKGKDPRPEYVEILCEVDCLVSIEGSLAAPVRDALLQPVNTVRSGCLSLGFSDDLCEVWLVS
jgi:CRISPR-associated protein Cas5t